MATLPISQFSFLALLLIAFSILDYKTSLAKTALGNSRKFMLVNTPNIKKIPEYLVVQKTGEKQTLIQLETIKENMPKVQKQKVLARNGGSTSLCTEHLKEWADAQQKFCAGLFWGKKKGLTAQHCTSGAYWAYFLLTGMKKVPENQANIALSGTLSDERSRKIQIERFIKKEGVYWGRVCSGNDDRQSPLDNPTGCFHSFAMTIGNNGVTIYQTMQSGWTMAGDWGIKTYSSKEFENKIFRATSRYDITAKHNSKVEFMDLFWYDPEHIHDMKNKGAPKVIVNGPVLDRCDEIPRIASFEFVKGKHNWGMKVSHPYTQTVNWPVTQIHGVNTMGENGVAEGGWMKNFYCMNMHTATKPDEPTSSIPRLCKPMCDGCVIS